MLATHCQSHSLLKKIQCTLEKASEAGHFFGQKIIAYTSTPAL